MKKTYYYILSTLFFTLLFCFKTNTYAATSIISGSIPITNGNNILIYTESYTDVLGEILTTEGNENGDTYAIFQPSFTLSLNSTNQKYLNGYVIVTIYITPTISGSTTTSFDGIEFTRPNTDGVNVVLVSYANNYFSFFVSFDNFYNQNRVDLGTYTLKYQAKLGDVTPIKGNFTTSITIANNYLEKSQYMYNNRTTELLYNAIYQATGSQLTNIINLLSSIQTQDYTYYTQIISGINQLHTDNNTLHTDLLNIINELDLDFQQVQTILDLFPSYRTQVLQYWQQLLEMNAAQSQAAAEAASIAADKDNQSQQLINGMGSVVMPSLGAGDLDILGGVDATQKTNFFGLIGLITHTEIITKIMLIIVIGAIVGYVLYGKK